MSKRESPPRDDLRDRSAGLRREFEEKLAALVEIPSVSMDPNYRTDVEKVAHTGCTLLRELGAQAECIKTAGLPLVLGSLVQDPKFPTVTIYNHLDVQPADAEAHPSSWSATATGGTAAAPPTTRGQPWLRSSGRDWLCRTACA